MGYFNYHAKAKKLISSGELAGWEIVPRHNAIEPALLLYFKGGLVMPIREHRWQEYFELFEKYQKQ